MPLDAYESGERTTADFLEKRNNLFFPNLRLLDEADVFIASFPRSGNDWLRTLLADVLLQQAGFATASALPVDLAKVVPGIYTDPVAETYKHRRDLLQGPPFLAVKTHHLVRAPDNRVVMLFRQPADVFVSYYHFRLTVGHWMTRDGLDAFAEHILPAWCGCMRHYLARIEARPARALAVCYERLHAAPEAQLGRVLGFLDLPVRSAEVARAVANHTFLNRRQVEEAWRRTQLAPDSKAPVLTRRGEVGEGARTFAPAVLDLIEAEAMPLYRRALQLA